MDIRPLRGWRYSRKELSLLIAPPYDVLNQADKDRLLAGSEHNIVAVDLPHVPPSGEGPGELYDQAARTLQAWQAQGVLAQDGRPCLYAYRQTFTWGGANYVRRAMLAGVRATPLGVDVIPHEHVFAGPKADRLRLTEATGVQLSPIMGFFHDENRGAMDALFANLGPADASGELGGVREEIWAVADEAVIADVAGRLADVPVFIADGHHRYSTALSYIDRLAADGLGVDHEARFVLFCLIARDDPGLRVLPTHRVVLGLKDGFSVHRLLSQCPQFRWRQVKRPAELNDADEFLKPFGRGAMAFIGPSPSETWIAQLADVAAMAAAAPDELPVWRELDVAVLHKLVVDGPLAAWRGESYGVEYTPHAPLALEACRSGRARLAVLLQGTPLDAVEAVALAGASMPHKSTYFYPKPATGMVLKPLT